MWPAPSSGRSSPEPRLGPVGPGAGVDRAAVEDRIAHGELAAAGGPRVELGRPCRPPAPIRPARLPSRVHPAGLARAGPSAEHPGPDGRIDVAKSAIFPGIPLASWGARLLP